MRSTHVCNRTKMFGVVSLTGALLASLRATSRSPNLLAQPQHKFVTKAGILAGLLSRSRDEGTKAQQNLTELSGPLLGSYTVPTPSTLWEAVLLWAVPKRRTSHSKKRMRMAHKYLKPKHHYQTCPKCGQLRLQHMLCGYCFRETMRLTAALRRQRAEGNTAEQGQEQEAHSPQLHASSDESH